MLKIISFENLMIKNAFLKNTSPLKNKKKLQQIRQNLKPLIFLSKNWPTHKPGIKELNLNEASLNIESESNLNENI